VPFRTFFANGERRSRLLSIGLALLLIAGIALTGVGVWSLNNKVRDYASISDARWAELGKHNPEITVPKLSQSGSVPTLVIEQKPTPVPIPSEVVSPAPVPMGTPIATATETASPQSKSTRKSRSRRAAKSTPKPWYRFFNSTR
jgi:hypothetical protein